MINQDPATTDEATKVVKVALHVQIVQEWVRQISQHQEQHIEEHHQTRSVRYDEDLELERFAFDIAETLVANMEKSAATTQKVGNKMEPRKKFEKTFIKRKIGRIPAQTAHLAQLNQTLPLQSELSTQFP